MAEKTYTVIDPDGSIVATDADLSKAAGLILSEKKALWEMRPVKIGANGTTLIGYQIWRKLPGQEWFQTLFYSAQRDYAQARHEMFLTVVNGEWSIRHATTAESGKRRKSK